MINFFRNSESNAVFFLDYEKTKTNNNNIRSSWDSSPKSKRLFLAEQKNRLNKLENVSLEEKLVFSFI